MRPFLLCAAAVGYFTSRTKSALFNASVQTCGGFADQRLALLSGLILARELGRAVVLPSLAAEASAADASTSLTFEAVYNTTHLAAALSSFGVQVAAAPARGSAASVAANDTEAALRQPHTEAHLSFGCPLLQLRPETILQNERFALAVLRALAPSASLAAAAEATLQRLGGASAFNLLHLSLEGTGLTHCSQWSWGQASAGCLRGALSLPEQLRVKGVELDVPLYLSVDREAGLGPELSHVLDSLDAAGFKVMGGRRWDLVRAASAPPTAPHVGSGESPADPTGSAQWFCAAPCHQDDADRRTVRLACRCSHERTCRNPCQLSPSWRRW